MIQELFPGDIQNLNCRSLANNRVLLDILEKKLVSFSGFYLSFIYVEFMCITPTGKNDNNNYVANASTRVL